jgi:hypothetical protein
MRLYALLLFAANLFSGQASDEAPDLHAIATRAVRNYQKDQLVSLRYTYVEHDDIKTKGLEVSRVTTILGTPYERLVEKNGKPLSADAEKHEEAKFEKTQFNRQKELKGQRDIRVRKWKEEIRFLEEAPEAFDFKMLPETEIDGRPTYVLDCKPKPGFEPRQERSKMFEKIEAKAWVDKRDQRIVKLEAETLDHVSIEWFLARIAKGTRMGLDQMRLENGDWVLKTLWIEGRARVMVVDNRQLDETATYSDYKLDPNYKPIK